MMRARWREHQDRVGELYHMNVYTTYSIRCTCARLVGNSYLKGDRWHSIRSDPQRLASCKLDAAMYVSMNGRVCRVCRVDESGC